ncbi:MAG: multicopper oxidase family protein [Kineosporiaceae bacterium]|nr:multicopper oxidase family protein [Kineosporiaceae bacterium]
MTDLNRRQFLRAAGSVASVATLSACFGSTVPDSTAGFEANGFVGPTDPRIAALEARRVRPGQRTVTARLDARQVDLDLGGRIVPTWAFGEDVPGPLIRATAGDLVTVEVSNTLPTGTSVHWHGIRLRNDMDGVPGLTQLPIAVGSTFTYSFTAPDPGTYWYHPHSGVQVDRALYGPMIVEDPAEPGDYDVEWIVVLDDWVDGTGRTPDDILAQLRASGGDMAPMAGMNGGASSGASSPAPPPPSPTGDAVIPGSMHSMNGISMSGIIYPHYLINGRLPTAPVTLTGKPGQRVRIRFVNAGSDTAFRVALGGHRLTVTHTDGFALTPTQADALIMGMGERWDVIVTLKDGVFPLMAIPEGKTGEAMALVRTGSGRAPDATVRPSELSRYVPFGLTLAPAPEAALPRRVANRIHKVVLEGRMDPYRWTINGRSHPDVEPFAVSQGDRVRLRIMNRSKMFHPWHIHGHTFALAATGMRKDTVLLRPMQAMNIEFEADNPGLWMAHCHNLYHAETGMMGTIAYQR